MEYTPTYKELETKIKELEENYSNELKNIEQKYKALLENGSDVIWTMNLQMQYSYISPSIYTQRGYTVEEFLNLPLDQVYTESSYNNAKEIFKQEISRVLAGFCTDYNYSATIKLEHKCKDGTTRWGEVKVSMLLDENGKFVGIHGITRDINDRVKIEQELKESELKFETLISYLPDYVIVHQNRKIVYTNESVSKAIGYSADEMLNSYIFDYIDTSYRHLVEENIQRKIKGENIDDYEIDLFAKSGKKMTVIVKSALINYNRLPAFITVLTDITSKKEVEKKIIESELKYRLLFEKATDGITIIQGDKFIDCNQKALEIFGCEKEDFLNKTPWFFSPEYQPSGLFSYNESLEKINNAVLNNSEVFEWVHKRLNGQLIYTEISLNKIEIANKILIQTIIRDVTDRKKSDERYKMLIENQEEGLCIVDLNEFFIFVNPAAEKIMDVASGNLINKSVAEFVSKEQFEIIQNHTKTRLSGIKSTYEIEIISKLGVEKSIQISSLPLYDDNQQVYAVFSVFRDITAYKNADKLLQQSIMRKQAILKAIPDLMFIYDKDGVFTNFWASDTSILLIEPDKIIGSNIKEIFPENFASTILQTISECLLTGDVKTIEYDLVINGEKNYYEARHVPVNEVEVLSMARNITERKKHEEELRISTVKAEESDRLKSAFLANMSHEIRTPLNGILGFAEILKMDKTISGESRDFLEIINSSGKHLLSLINDIVDLSKIEAGQLKINPQPCMLNELLSELYLFFDNNTNSKINIHLRTSLPNHLSEIEIDDVRLKQVLTNLISNALKFTKEGFVEFGYSLKGDVLQFFVKDSGVGFSKDKLQIIFERFRQADEDTTRHYGGAGLGLAISKNLVELMGGAIWAESEIGKGTVFYFNIPYLSVNKLIEKPIDTFFELNNVDWSQKTILVVEDVDAMYLYIRKLLEKAAIKVIRAENGMIAVDICSKNYEIDAIFMDIQLPIMNGYEAANLIHKMNPELPIIAQTANAFANEKNKCLDSGCIDLITKPFDPKTLYGVLQKYIK